MKVRPFFIGSNTRYFSYEKYPNKNNHNISNTKDVVTYE